MGTGLKEEWFAILGAEHVCYLISITQPLLLLYVQPLCGDLAGHMVPQSREHYLTHVFGLGGREARDYRSRQEITGAVDSHALGHLTVEASLGPTPQSVPDG